MNNDLISRSELLEDIDKERKRLVERNLFGAEHLLVHPVRRLIENAPAVDAVEVVRCKDCKHWGIGYGVETEHIKACCFANYMVGKNGYCVYGERKMDSEVE